MREMFPGYNPPDSKGLESLWNECVFSVDANILLNPYRYSPELQSTFFQVFEGLKDRLWVPNQAVLEFYDNRFQVISEQLERFRSVGNKLNTLLDPLKEAAKDTKNRHLSLNIQEILTILERAQKEAKDVLKQQRDKHPNFFTNDPVLDKLTLILEGRVGEPYSEEELSQIYQKAEWRYSQLIPPGHEDDRKPGYKKYGDAVLWFQLIDYAKAAKRAIIMITDDTKDDWWRSKKGKRVEPRPELVQEMLLKANVAFFMYNSGVFLEKAAKYLQRPVSKAVIKEAKDVSYTVESAQRLNQWLLAYTQLLNATRRNPYITNRDVDPVLLENLRNAQKNLQKLLISSDLSSATGNFLQMSLYDGSAENLLRYLERKRPISESTLDIEPLVDSEKEISDYPLNDLDIDDKESEG